ncbi:LuxR C-terminal-related transcriptional regulator [Dryocola sp. BD626]|uniref:helix-turn-helix transcriptional regulator n=1 Tax=Dryocola sp. BD626 TaxID=3133273 RepID=UPI003F50ADD7
MSEINKGDKCFIIYATCELTKVGIRDSLRNLLYGNDIIHCVQSYNEALKAVFRYPQATLIIELDDVSPRLLEMVNFIHWYCSNPSDLSVVAFTANHKRNVLNYLYALGLTAIISQFEPLSVFRTLILNSLNSERIILSPVVDNIMNGEFPTFLTPKEAEVMGKLFIGESVSEVAKSLGRDVRTISSHKRRAMEKLGLLCERDIHSLGHELVA